MREKSKKLKPAWKKTDIPKDTCVKLWRIMKDNVTYASWVKKLAKADDIAEDDELFVRNSRDTYKQLKGEVNEMPLNEILTLPKDVKYWILELRSDLKEELEQHNMQSVNQSQIQGEYQTKQQKDRDPLIIDAKKQHMGEIQDLIKRWSETIWTCDIQHYEYYEHQKLIDIQKKPLFQALKKHVPDENLWKNYNDWCNKYETYLLACYELRKKIKKEAFQFKKPSQNINVHIQGFREAILSRIHYTNIARALNNIDSSYDYRDSIDIDPPYLPQEFEFECNDETLETTDGYRILTAKKVMDLSDEYQSIANSILSSQQAHTIKSLFPALRDIENNIKAILQDTLLGRKYLIYSCQLCEHFQPTS